MNRWIHIVRYTVFSLLFFLSLQVYSQQKYMLCVGINNYTGNNRDTITTWDDRAIPNLKGCVNDVGNIAQTFIQYYGFTGPNIKKLLDRDAKRDSIMANLKQFAAICKRGDYMVFYYSGHGSLVYDDATQKNFLKGYEKHHCFLRMQPLQG